MPNKWLSRSLLLLASLLLGAVPVSVAQDTHSYRYSRSGNAAGVHGSPRAGFALMGGGADLDQAYQWLCRHAAGGDLLVLRATGTGSALY